MPNGGGADQIEVFSGIVVPILIFLAGIVVSIIGSVISNIISRKIALIPYSKSAYIEIDLNEKQFKVYNTGRATIVMKRIGVSSDRWGKKELFSTEVLKALTVERDPLVIPVNESDFIMGVESSVAGGKYPSPFYCFIADPHGKKYCCKSTEDLWADHELYFGRNPKNNDADESDLPF